MRINIKEAQDTLDRAFLPIASRELMRSMISDITSSRKRYDEHIGRLRDRIHTLEDQSSEGDQIQVIELLSDGANPVDEITRLNEQACSDGNRIIQANLAIDSLNRSLVESKAIAASLATQVTFLEEKLLQSRKQQELLVDITKHAKPAKKKTKKKITKKKAPKKKAAKKDAEHTDGK